MSSDPAGMVVHLVLSVSIAVSESFARQESLEKGDYPFSPASPSVTVPWIIVEYVKISCDGLDPRPIHEAHLTGAFEVAFGLYRALGLDLPLFGILVDERDIDIYVASAVKAKVSDLPNSPHISVERANSYQCTSLEIENQD